MHRLTLSRLTLVVLTFALSAPAMLAAGAPRAERVYVVTLRPAAAVDGVRTVAQQLISSYGGAVVDGARESSDAILMRLLDAQTRLFAADPRVQSVVPVRFRMAANAPAQTVGWASGVSYNYDGAGDVTGIGSDKFVYDAAGRVVQATVNGVQRNYTYDGFGNRTQCQQTEQTGFTDCQVLTINTTEGKNRFNGVTYDASGNIQVAPGLGIDTYSYDALNMMTSDVSGAVTHEFVYTADDERIATYTVGSSWRWTIRETSGKVLREFASQNGPSGVGTASWQWAKDHVWRDGLLLASLQPNGARTTTYHYHLDNLGTPRLVTDQDNQLVGVHDYFAFGPEVSGGTSEPFATTLKYTGHERDASAAGSLEALDYMHARYCSPTLAHFLSVDPVLNVKLSLTNPQSWNRYTYVRNNPIRGTDPSGKVVNMDDAFLQRLRTDRVFLQAFQSWKETKSGAAQWRAMVEDSDTLYMLSVARVYYQASLLSDKFQENGMTLPLPYAAQEEKWGQLNNPWTKSTVNVDYIEETGSKREEARVIAGALFEEIAHALDMGSGTRTLWGAYRAEEGFHSEPKTEPRWIRFEKELAAVLPPEE